MNHQPFREWLLSEQELSAEQSHMLAEHLSSCQSCSQIETSWKEVEDAFQKIPFSEPEPGFTTRWQSHLAEYQVARQKQKGWFIISGMAVIVTALLASLIYQVSLFIQNPEPYLAIIFERFMGVISIYFNLRNIIGEYSWSTPLYTFIVLFFFVGILSFMSVLWLATYRKLSLARRSA